MNLSDSKIIENPQLFYGCLHFKYNSKKYLYGLTEELLTCGSQVNLLSKINGTYEPSERQKKQKSSLLLKKQKTLLKIDYIIIPRKACQHQYLWHFQQLTSKLDCKQFLILPLTKEQRKNKDSGIDFITRKRLIELLNDQKQGSSNGLPYSHYGYKFQSFKDHQNVIKKTSQNNHDKQKSNKRPNEQIEDFQKPEEIIPIYEYQLDQIVLSLVKTQMNQLSIKSLFKYIKPNSYLKNVHDLVNNIRHNSNLPQVLQLTKQQIQEHKIQLSQQIMRISAPDQVFYPTESQNINLIFLPQTSMVILLHKHDIALINPCNLASWKLHYLSLPVSKVKYVLLTRFSMAFVEFIVAWGAVGQEQKLHTFLQVATLQGIYERIKLKLKKNFLWTDEMIRSKIAFRIILPSRQASNKQKNLSSLAFEKQQFYSLGFIKVMYKEGETRQDVWIMKFGNREFCLMNELISLNLQWVQRFDYLIFDRINGDSKKLLYQVSGREQDIKKKLIYNRSSSSKFKNKYFVFLEQSNPIINLYSQIRIQQTFAPHLTSELDSQRYQKVKLKPGDTINCLERNILLVEGLVLALYPKLNTVYYQGVDRQVVQTEVELCYPVDFVKNGNFFDLNLLKIRNIHELVCLKHSLIYIQETQNQIFYFNSFGKSKPQLLKSQYMLTKAKVPFGQPSVISASGLEIQALSSNSLIKHISPLSSNFCFTHNHSSQSYQDTKQQGIDCIEVQSPYHNLNELFRKVNFESGQMINEDNSKVFLVLKGFLKWDDRNQQGPKAKNNALMGNLGKFYEQQIARGNKSINFQYSQDSEILPIKVVKDTYVVEADLLELHERYFVDYPQVAYWILQKGNIFY